MLNNLEETGKHWASPGAQGENLRFFDFPAFYLMSLAGMAKQDMVRNHLEPWGLTMPEWRLMSTVAERSPIRFSQIAQLTAMDKAQVSRALRSAQAKGLVESSILTVPNGHVAGGVGRMHVSITAAGRETFSKVMPSIQRQQLRLLELMSPEERRVVARVARRLICELSQADAGAPARGYQPETGELAAAGQAV